MPKWRCRRVTSLRQRYFCGHAAALFSARGGENALRGLLRAVAGAAAFVLGAAVAAVRAGLNGDAGQRAVVLIPSMIGAGFDVAADVEIGRFRTHDNFLHNHYLELRCSLCPETSRLFTGADRRPRRPGRIPFGNA